MAETVEVAIEYALLQRLEAFATANGLSNAIAMPNVAFTPPTPGQNVKWLRATFLPADTVGLGVSDSSSNQHYGFLQVDVFHGLGAGELAPLRIAAALIAYFKRGTTVTKDGFTAQIWKTPFRAPMLKDDSWVNVPVRIPYICLAPNPA
jgi:hypothetical protein